MSKNTANLSSAARVLIDRFLNREARVGVVGLGYVGLPLAIVLAEAGFRVIGIDSDPDKVEILNQGQSYIKDVQHHQVEPLITQKKFEASVSYQALEGVDAVIICVPTPLRKTGDPDLSFIISAAKAVRPVIHAGMLVILESTSYPGTTREMVQPELEASGLQVGEDLFLAFSPERVDPGRKDWTTFNTPKVIGGITPACTEVAATFYNQAIESVVRVSSTEVAEMTKLLENTFRAVNIGLVNEVALMCDRLGIDVWEVIEAAASKPFGFMKFTPGPGLGGHCIPIDPLYLSWKLKSVKYNARFIELASEINTSMPRYVVERVQDALNDRKKPLKGSQLLILGVAYKPNVSDTRESPALDVIGLLLEKKAQVEYYDPHVPSLEHEGWSLKSIPDLIGAVEQADCVVVITDHDSVDYPAVAEAADLIFDTRNAMGEAGVEDPKVVKL
ncbi:MAG: UDP-N-acetyl-D-glucosamine dehydrogenase [Anaerolineae bacterium SM23_ 63]|nr:MAG: UDP-N-acetyl-D-glucosamine dehydrogenase [Anaerolineae bacterium SM23_ 63]